MLDTRICVILVVSAVLLAFPIWYLRSYFNTIPTELDEAAMVDGCTRMSAILKVVLPIALPGILATVIMLSTVAWQQFLLPFVLLSSDKKYPLTIGLYNMLGEQIVPWHLVMAMTIISVLPPLIIFFFASRKIISGFTAGALK